MLPASHLRQRMGPALVHPAGGQRICMQSCRVVPSVGVVCACLCAVQDCQSCGQSELWQWQCTCVRGRPAREGRRDGRAGIHLLRRTLAEGNTPYMWSQSDEPPVTQLMTQQITDHRSHRALSQITLVPCALSPVPGCEPFCLEKPTVAPQMPLAVTEAPAVLPHTHQGHTPSPSLDSPGDRLPRTPVCFTLFALNVVLHKHVTTGISQVYI